MLSRLTLLAILFAFSTTGAAQSPQFTCDIQVAPEVAGFDEPITFTAQCINVGDPVPPGGLISVSIDTRESFGPDTVVAESMVGSPGSPSCEVFASTGRCSFEQGVDGGEVLELTLSTRSLDVARVRIAEIRITGRGPYGDQTVEYAVVGEPSTEPDILQIPFIVNFGGTIPDDGSRSDEFRVYNQGLTELEYSCEFSDAAQFTISGCGGTVAPGEFSQVNVACQAGQNNDSGFVVINSNDPDRPEVSVFLDCDRRFSGPEIFVAEDSLTFTPLEPEKLIFVRNFGAFGSDPLTLDCSVDNQAVFSISNCDGILTGSKDLVVRCDSSAGSGIENGVLTISNNDSNENPVLVQLQCDLRPDIFINLDDVIDFGELATTESVMVQQFIRNLGGGTLEFSCTVGDPINFAVSGCPDSLDSLNWENLEVSCLAGEEVGVISSNLIISSNDSEEPVLDIRLICTRVADEAALSVVDDLVDFGVIYTDAAPVAPIFLQNLGASSASISCALTNEADFVLESCPDTLGQLEDAEIQVSCRTLESEGRATGSVIVSSNGLSNPVSVPLSCERISGFPDIVVEPDTDRVVIDPFGYDQQAITITNDSIRDALDLECAFSAGGRGAASVAFPQVADLNVLSLGLNQSQVVVFACDGAQADNNPGRLTCDTNDPSQPVLAVEVLCAGQIDPRNVPTMSNLAMLAMLVLLMLIGLGYRLSSRPGLRP